ncbi:MAG TPA: glutaredoxin family protein [Methylotenera sp.]|jgi:glutaredoxin
MTQLVLYTTSHCHLCEQALTLLINLKQQYAINWLTKEISEDDDLIEKYGIRIPVIQRVDNQSELNWPFSAEDIVMLIKA